MSDRYFSDRFRTENLPTEFQRMFQTDPTDVNYRPWILRHTISITNLSKTVVTDEFPTEMSVGKDLLCSSEHNYSCIKKTTVIIRFYELRVISILVKKQVHMTNSQSLIPATWAYFKRRIAYILTKTQKLAYFPKIQVFNA